MTVLPISKYSMRDRKTFILLSTIVLLGLIVGGYFLINQQHVEQRISIAVADFDNHTPIQELDGISGMCITALQQSKMLSVLSRTRMLDLLRETGEDTVDHISANLAREICRRAIIKYLITGTITTDGGRFIVDLTIVNPITDERLFTFHDQEQQWSDLPLVVDRLVANIRSSLYDRTGEIEKRNKKVGEMTTLNVAAYRHYFYGEQLINRLRFIEAESEFTKAIALDSTFALAYYRLAYAIAWYRGNEHAQREPLQKSLALIDRLPEREQHLLLAEKLRREHGSLPAIQSLKELEKLYPEDKEVLFMIGDWLYHDGHVAASAEYFKKTLSIDPTFGRALHHLVGNYEALGQYDKMLTTAKQYVSLKSSEESFVLLKQACEVTGDLSLALSALQTAKRLFPKQPVFSGYVVDFHIYLDQYDKAEAELKTMFDTYGDTRARAAVSGGASNLDCYQGRYRDALGARDKNINTYRKANDTNLAAASQIHKGLLYMLGWNDRIKAANEIEATIPLQHSITTLWYWSYLAYLQSLLGRSDVAEQYLNDKVHSDQWLFNVFQSIVSSVRGECTQVTADSILRSRDGGWVKIVLLYSLAQCQVRSGSMEDAKYSLLQLQRVFDNTGWIRAVYYPKSLFLLGTTYEQTGETERAISTYEKLLSLWKHADADLPDLLDAKKRIHQLNARHALDEQ